MKKEVGSPKAGGKKRCNELDGRTWTRYSISIWNDISKSRKVQGKLHPAAFPLQLAERCIEIFTAGPGIVVLDPFAGSGSTLIAAHNLGRQGLGIELYSHYEKLFSQRLAEEGRLRDSSYPFLQPHLISGDARRLGEYVEPASVDFVLTSPPYWDILFAKRSADKKVQRFYGEDAADLGCPGEYSAFLLELQGVFRQVKEVLKPGSYCVVVVMDLRKKNLFFPLHIDLTQSLKEIGFQLDDIILWDRRHEYSSLRPLGYPYVFRVNKIHEYLLIFKVD